MRCGGGTASVEARRRTHIAVLTISSMVCGGMVAAIGPSIDSFAYATGLDQASIGLAIMHNRIAKLVGLGLWTVYANALQRGGGFGLRPRTLMAGCMLVTSLLSLAIAHIHWSHLVLRASLAAFGLCYGIVDSASLQLAIWSSDSIEKSRLSVATVSAGFTLGATVSPIVVAAALKMGGTAHPGFSFLAVVCSLGFAGFLCAPPLPTGPMRHAAPPDGSPSFGGGKGGKGERRELLGEEAEEAAEEAAEAGGRCGGALAAPGYGEGRGRRNPSVLLVSTAISLVLFCLTSVEHAVATWLPTFGSRVGNVDAATMAVLTGVFWGTIALGRIVWSCVSSRMGSAWPVVFFDGLLMLTSSFLYLCYTASFGHQPCLLWLGTIGLGLGMSSGFPCALTLPAEAHVSQTPTLMMGLMLMGSAGEMAGPVVLGAFFEQEMYASLGYWVVLLQVVGLTATLVAYKASHRRLPAPARET